MLLQSPWILPNPPEMVSQLQCNRRCHTARLASSTRDAAKLGGQQSCESAFTRKRNASCHVCWNFQGFGHGEARVAPPRPNATLIAQNNQFATSCCQFWVCRFFLSSNARKKSAKFWATHPSGPEFWMLNFGTSKREPERWGPERWARRVGAPKAWPK